MILLHVEIAVKSKRNLLQYFSNSNSSIRSLSELHQQYELFFNHKRDSTAATTTSCMHDEDTGCDSIRRHEMMHKTPNGGKIDPAWLPTELFPREHILHVRIGSDDHDHDPANDTRNHQNGNKDNYTYQVYLYELSHEEIATEEIDPNGTGGGGEDTGGGDGGDWVTGCDSTVLPHHSLEGMWENLIFDSSTGTPTTTANTVDENKIGSSKNKNNTIITGSSNTPTSSIKNQLLSYASSALLFSTKNVSNTIIQWNRIVLLYGPPGTGKTSLNKALGQKLSIRLATIFPRTTLLEIHSHSLFSKWFSTSGKLIAALFALVRDMVLDDPQCLIIVVIDEIESLASHRGGNGSGGGGSNSGDPSDAMRAVNSLLTSLDKLKSYPNVLILATTNLTGHIDTAFIDRIDLKLFIDVPILRARYNILKSCCEELVRVGIIRNGNDNRSTTSSISNGSTNHNTAFAIYNDAMNVQGENNNNNNNNENGNIITTITTEINNNPNYDLIDFALAIKEEHQIQCDNDQRHNNTGMSGMLLSCSRMADGLSGRSLRRLPLQAHTQFLASGGSSSGMRGENMDATNDDGTGRLSMISFLHSLSLAISSEQKSREI